MALATLSIDLVAKMATFEKDLQRTVKVVEGSAGQMSGALALVKSSVAGLAGAFSVGIAVDFVRNTINSVDALNDLKDATGSSVENLSALEDIALRNGNSFEAMASSVVKFNKVLTEATPGSDMAKTLQSIGLNAAELRKMDPSEALLKTAQALAGYADDGNKARLIQDLFGKSIREAGPWLKDLAEAGQLNAKVTAEQADEAERYNKNVAAMQKNVLDLARYLSIDLVTGINAAAKAMKEGGLLEGFRTLLTGDDAHTANVSIVKLTDLVLSAENALDKARAKGDAAQVARLTNVVALRRQELASIQGYKKLLEGPPAAPDTRPSAPPARGKTDAAGKTAKTEIDDNARALAQYVKGLEQATERTMDLTESEKARLFLTTLGKTGEVAQVRELVLGMATRLDQEKELTQLMALRRAAAAAAGDAVNAENEWLAQLVARAPSGQLEAQRAEQARLAEMFTSGTFGDPASLAAIDKYSELARTALGTIGAESDTLAKRLETLGEGIRDEFANTGKLSGQSFANLFMAEIRKGIYDEFIGGSVKSLLSGTGGLIAGVKSLFGFADGGIMTSAGPLPLRAYATGGVASSPQLAMYGEGSRPEAFVPLPDGRTIPVTMKGGAGRAVVVNISNQIGDVASTATVVKGMQAVRAQIMGELSRGQRMGGAYA